MEENELEKIVASSHDADPSNSPEAKWYALHTFSGYENVAKENLETVRTKFGLENRIFDIIIPMETVLEEKNGKKNANHGWQRSCRACIVCVYRSRYHLSDHAFFGHA